MDLSCVFDLSKCELRPGPEEDAGSLFFAKLISKPNSWMESARFSQQRSFSQGDPVRLQRRLCSRVPLEEECAY